jgi:hypothetical protein
MSRLTHPLFGDIDLAAGDYWAAEIEYAGHPVKIDLNIEGGAINAADFERVMHLAGDLATLDGLGRGALRADYDQGEHPEGVALYHTHHLDVLDEAELAKCFGTADRKAIDIAALLARLRLCRVGLYPKSPERGIVLDYSIGKEVTDYLLAVSVDTAGEVVEVAMES